MSRQPLDAEKGKWDALAKTWCRTGPPSAPSPMDLEIYRRLLEAEPHETVLMLGCTPSIRELLGRGLKIAPRKIILADFSIKMYQSTTQTLAIDWGEDFVLTDWCAKFSAPVADIVVGDRALDNVPLEWRRDFFQNIRHHVRDNALFINHTALTDNIIETSPISSIINRWVEMAGSGVRWSQCIDGLWDDLLTTSFRHSPDSGVLNVGSIMPEIERGRRSGENDGDTTSNRLVSEMIAKYEGALDYKWYTATLEQVRCDALPDFILEDIKWASDYVAAEHHPFLCMRANSEG